MPGPIDTIREAPKAFAAAFAKVNAAIKLINAMSQMEGRGGIKITKADGNWIIEYNPDEVGTDGLPSAGGVPDGYEETLVTICDSGTPTDVYMLVKPSE